MAGSGPSWSSQAPRWVSRACTRPQAAATAVPYREVSVLVVTCGAGQVAGSASASSPPCLQGRPGVPGGHGGAGSCITRSLRSRPKHLGGQVREQVRQPGQVVSGIEDDQDRRVTIAPVPGGDQPGDHIADLRGGDCDLVVVRAQPHRIQHRGPGGAAGFQRRDHRVRPARDHLRLALPAAIHMAEQSVWAGRCAGNCARLRISARTSRKTWKRAAFPLVDCKGRRLRLMRLRRT